MTIHYQFTTDQSDHEHPIGAAIWPMRGTWEEAAADAVAAGYAHWENDAVLVLHEERGARIRSIKS